MSVFVFHQQAVAQVMNVNDDDFLTVVKGDDEVSAVADSLL